MHFAPLYLSSWCPTRKNLIGKNQLFWSKKARLKLLLLMFSTSFLSNKNTLSRNPQCIFIHLALYLAANCVAFCTKSHCILHQITLRFAPNCTAFCTILHCVLHQNAAFFAANRTLSCYSCNFMQYQRLCQCFIVTSLLHKKNARENRFFRVGWTIGEL